MDDIANTKEKLRKVQQMSEEHPTTKEVEECIAIREKFKEFIEQVRVEFDDFKAKLNALVASRRGGSRTSHKFVLGSCWQGVEACKV